MRDPERIDVFCRELAVLWHRVPDWRFGQFISNVMGAVASEHGDIFFPEDGDMLEYMKEYFSTKESGGKDA